MPSLNRFRAAAMLLVSLLLAASAATATAQYHFDVWTADDGLPQNIVRGIRQSADGYLWLATLDGLARFDGVRFTTYNKANTPGIASNRFGSMVQTTDGDLWLVAESAGVTRLHKGVFVTYGAEKGIPGGIVKGINADHAGHVWILTADHILLWQPTSGRFTDVTPAAPRLRFTPSIWTNGGFWASDGTTLFLFHEGTLKRYAIPPPLRNSPIAGAGIDPDTSVMMETRDGRQGRVFPPGHVGAAFSVGPQTTTWQDRTGHRWMMPVGLELRRYLDDIAEVPGGRIPFDCFFEDRQGNLWLGTEGHGLYRFKRQVIKSYSTAEGLPAPLVYPVLADHNGDILAGIWGSGVSRFHDGQFTTVAAPRFTLGNNPIALFEDHAHRIWVGSSEGLATLEAGHFLRATQPVLPQDATVQAMEQSLDGTLWFGTNQGLIRFKDGQTRLLTQADGLASNDVRALLWSHTGDLWIAGYGGLSRMHAGRFEHWFEADGLPSNTIRSLYEDRNGTLWIGTYDHGLGRFAGGRFTRYDQTNGLFDDGAFAILEDSFGNLWMSSNRGIYSVALSQLEDFAAGRLDSVTSVPYGKGDGMINIECNGGASPSAVKARDGRLWFPTQNGLAVVNPADTYIDAVPPPVIIESVELNRASVPVTAPLRIPPGGESLEIKYTSTSFIKPLQIHFKYRMNGLESTWNDAGSRRTAYYSHLPPGSYSFQVIAGNSDGTWNLIGQSLAVTVLPPFYRTWWFVTVLVFFALALVWLAWRRRTEEFLRRQTQRQAFSTQLITSQEVERKRIAAELHDGVGQRLVVINQLAQQIQARSASQPVSTILLGELTAETKAAIQETRDISYGLRPFQLDRLGLTKSIAAIIRSATQASGIQVISELDNIDDFFPEDRRIDLYRVVQECFNNIVKHAHATEVFVRLERTHDGMVLSIEDNGVGIPAMAPDTTDRTGFGLLGMAERAHLLGGSLHIRSVPGSTIVTLEVKATSYATPSKEL